MIQSRLPLFIGMLLYAALFRCLPYLMGNYSNDPWSMYYPWNLSPLTAICLFSGACMKDRRVALALPLASLLVGDLMIWGVSGHLDWAFPRSFWMTYVMFAGAVFLGTWLRQTESSPQVLRAVTLGMAFECLFFALSNLVVWYSGDGPSPLYSKDLGGLIQCYIAAIPFFGRSLIGTSLFTSLIFGLAADRRSQFLNELQPTTVSGQ